MIDCDGTGKPDSRLTPQLGRVGQLLPWNVRTAGSRQRSVVARGGDRTHLLRSRVPGNGPVLQERAWLASATAGQAASIPYLEKSAPSESLSIGAQSRQVEQTTSDIAKANGKAGSLT